MAGPPDASAASAERHFHLVNVRLDLIFGNSFAAPTAPGGERLTSGIPSAAAAGVNEYPPLSPPSKTICATSDSLDAVGRRNAPRFAD